MSFSVFFLSKKIVNGLISFFIIWIWIFVVLIIAYPEEESANELGLAFFIYSTLFFGLFSGLIVSATRMVGFIKDTSNFLYIFTGVLNTCLGIFGIYLVLTNQQGLPWVMFFLFSFIIGSLIFLDILMKKTDV